jgi:hypothetical protein
MVMENGKPNSKLSRRGFSGKMAGGVLGASLVAKGEASAARLGDSDFDLDVRLSPTKSSEQKVAQGATDAATCRSTCGNTCGNTCGGTCGCPTHSGTCPCPSTMPACFR